MVPAMQHPLRVLVVDDSVTYRVIVAHALAAVPGVEVTGVAANGKVALERIEQLQPDLLTLDVEMPEMNGLELLRRLKDATRDVGVIMLSALTGNGADATIEALGLGAFDFVLKPGGGTFQANTDKLQQELSEKIEPSRRSRKSRRVFPHATPRPAPTKSPAPAPAAEVKRPAIRPRRSAVGADVVAIGISTGGPQALNVVLPELPADLPAPVLVVQHMPPVFTRSLAEGLDRRCALRVCEAAESQPVQHGTIYVAPGGKQMKVEKQGGIVRVRLTDDPPEHSCRPSVDYLFRSVADVYGPRTVGVIMTGMGYDGNDGFRLLHRLGAPLLAQDRATSVVYGMPRLPIEEGIAQAIPLENMSREIVRLVEQGAAACSRSR
jgi:two-component system, chemotaxis family, protein-glutamate methylesterase/glutaminase